MHFQTFVAGAFLAMACQHQQGRREAELQPAALVMLNQQQLTERLARAACDHEQACDKIAEGSQSPGLYADQEDCMQEFELTAQRTVEACVGPVESTRIEPCLEDVTAANCGILSFDHFESCRVASMCRR